MRYIYDSWGKLLSMTDTTSGGVGSINPFRYRGYYWDAESGLYYLQSRYYDPETGRFVNADGILDAGAGTAMTNLYAYCGNDPVNSADPSGMCKQDYLVSLSSCGGTYYWKCPLKELMPKVSISKSIGAVKKTATSTVATGINSSISGSVGPFSHQVSSSIGYAEGMGRGQSTTPQSNITNTMLGAYGKASVYNQSTQSRVGSANIGISRKEVIDIGVVTAQAGVQYKQGLGVSVGGRASVGAIRRTYCIDIYGWQIEVGVEGQVLTAGAEASCGFLPDGGLGCRATASAGVAGGGFLVRVVPSW